MGQWLKTWQACLRDKRFLAALAGALIFLAAGIASTYFAIIYATESASNAVTDIILSNIPVYDIDGIFIYGPVIYWIVIGLYAVAEPKRLPFALKNIAVFSLIRSVFLTLTHIGPFPERAVTAFAPDSVICVFTSGSDLFFSSHTGLPFLMALVFWQNKRLRIFSIIASLFFGAVVLLSHVHYSIDVFAAFFITYAIFHIAEKLFAKDRELFRQGLRH